MMRLVRVGFRIFFRDFRMAEEESRILWFEKDGCKIARVMKLVRGAFRIFLGILGRLKRSREDCGWKK